MRTQNRERFSRYFEVFMDASMEALLRRDTKGLYQDALTGARPMWSASIFPFRDQKRPTSRFPHRDQSRT